jgi:N-acetyl-anhydromuramyl-L-alanine amidase AmpD
MRRLTCLIALACGCTTAAPPAPEGPVALTIDQAAARNAVPADLMKAIAAVEGGLLLSQQRFLRADEDVPVGGVLELRHGYFNSLARGAELMGTTEDVLRVDTDLATEAGARVLAELGTQTGASLHDLATWRQAVDTLGGISDAAAKNEHLLKVYSVLKSGGTFPARGGEQVVIPAHPDLEMPLVARVEAASGTPDFPGAIWFQTSCTNKCDTTRTAGNGVVNMIAIHDTEGGWDASVATLQNDAGKSVHYIVDADGSRVGQFVPETYTAWHVGNYYYNQRMVGIEHVGFASNTAGYSDGLYKKSVELVKSIRTRWTVPLDRDHIIGHYQVPDGNTIAGGESAAPCEDTLNNCETSANYGGADNHRDPGYYWQWCQYMQMLGGECHCNDTYPLWNCTSDKTEAVRCTNGKVEIQNCTAGCVSMAIGVNDVCNMKAMTGSDGGTGGGADGGTGGTGGSGGSGGTGGSGGSSGSGGNGDTTGGGGSGGSGSTMGSSQGGCTMAGSAEPIGLLALMLFCAAGLLLRRACSGSPRRS